MAPATPPISPAPPATAPARANCDAPVKARRLNTQAWATFIPEPTAAAPKATPETPTASPSAMPSRTGRARARSTNRSSISVTCMRLGGYLRQVLNVLAALAVALIRARWHAHHPLEMPGQVGLVGEPGLRRDVRGSHAAVEQLPGQPHAQVVHVSVRWQAGLRAERPDQRERVHVKLAGQVIQARRVSQPVGKQVADRADGGGGPVRARRGTGPVPWTSMPPEQPGQRGPQQAGRGEPVAVLGGDVGRAQQPGTPAV